MRPAHRRAAHRRAAGRLLPVLLVTAGLAGACGEDPVDGPAAGSTAAVADSPAGPAYQSVEDLAETLTDEGLPCTLQYPGLRDDLTDAELSICTVAGDQAYLRVWDDRAQVASFLSSPEAQTGTVAVGANWTVNLTTESAARQVALALGGTVPTAGPPTATGTP